MAKKTLFELENGKIEYSHDGETEVYTYNGTPLDQLTEDQKAEIRESQSMKELVKQFNAIADTLTRVFNEAAKAVAPAFNHALKVIKEAEAEAEKAKKKSKAKKKGKKDGKK